MDSSDASRLTLPLLLALAAGIVLGLVYGWVIQPTEFVDTAPSALRSDYRADYVLMVAESYSGDPDLDLARRRLAALGPMPPAQIVLEAQAYAEAQQFSEPDLQRLASLAQALQARQSTPEIGPP